LSQQIQNNYFPENTEILGKNTPMNHVYIQHDIKTPYHHQITTNVTTSTILPEFLGLV
jgi:hypothetical protein